MDLSFHFWLALSQVLDVLGLDLFKITVLLVTLSLNSIIGAHAYTGKYCCIWWSHKCNFYSLNFLILWMKTGLQWKTGCSFFWKHAMGPNELLNSKMRDCLFVYRDYPWCVQLCIKLQKHGQCKGREKYRETVFEFCRRTLHARLQTGPGGGSEQSELPLTNFCLLVDFLLDIVSLVRIALFVANTGILYIYSLQKYYICFINYFSWKYIAINWWRPLEEVLVSLYRSW